MNNDIWKGIGIVLVLGIVFFVIALLSARLTSINLADAVSVIYAIGVLTAICVGGFFANRRLQLFRTFQPHLTISHEVSHRLIGDSYIHIFVTATLHNGSRVKMELLEADFLLQQIAPTNDDRIEHLYADVFHNAKHEDLQWDTLYDAKRNWSKNERIIEPGELHKEPFEFIVSTGVESVLIYTYFYNPGYTQGSQAAQGWGATRVYDILNE